MGLAARRVVGLPPDASDVLIGDLHARLAQGGEQTPHRRLAGFDRRHVFGDQGLQLGALQRHAAPHAAQEQRHVGQVTAEGFQHARGHEMVERRDRLPAVLLVLVGLEDDRGQRGVALDRLRRAHRAVLRRESPFVDVTQIVLNARRGLRGIVVQVVNVNVPVAVGAAVAHAHQIFQGVVLGDLRGEGHHLPRGRVRRHVGVRKVDVVLLDGHDAVHDALDRRAAVAFDVAPLAVDDITFGDRGVAFHQPLLDHVLNLLDRNLGLRNCRRHVGCDLLDGLPLVRYAARAKGLRDGADDFIQRKRLGFTITFDDGNLRVIHCNMSIYVSQQAPFPRRADIACAKAGLLTRTDPQAAFPSPAGQWLDDSPAALKCIQQRELSGIRTRFPLILRPGGTKDTFAGHKSLHYSPTFKIPEQEVFNIL